MLTYLTTWSTKCADQLMFNEQGNTKHHEAIHYSQSFCSLTLPYGKDNIQLMTTVNHKGSERRATFDTPPSHTAWQSQQGWGEACSVCGGWGRRPLPAVHNDQTKMRLYKMTVLIIIQVSITSRGRIKSHPGFQGKQQGRNQKIPVQTWSGNTSLEIFLNALFRTKKTHGIFSFSESITKQCFTAHFLNQFSYPSRNQTSNLNTLYLSILL